MIALRFIIGSIGSGFLGARSAMSLAASRRMLKFIFAGIIFTMAIYMLVPAVLCHYSCQLAERLAKDVAKLMQLGLTLNEVKISLRSAAPGELSR